MNDMILSFKLEEKCKLFWENQEAILENIHKSASSQCYKHLLDLHTGSTLSFQ